MNHFKNILNKYWLKVIGNYIPNSLIPIFYEAYIKARLKKEITPEDFIKGFFVYIGKGKGLFIDKKA